MTILAIDPGPEKSAWLLFDPGSHIPIPVHGIHANDDVLPIVAAYAGQADIVIEGFSSYGMPVGRETFDAVRWSGRFEQAAYPHDAHYILRRDVKLHLCGQVRAKDSNVRVALIDKYGGPSVVRKGGPLYRIKADEWAALALAVTFSETR